MTKTDLQIKIDDLVILREHLTHAREEVKTEYDSGKYFKIMDDIRYLTKRMANLRREIQEEIDLI